MITIRAMRALAWVLAAGAALTGCGGSSADGPRSLPPVSAPATSSPTSQLATGADLPAEARPATSAGAEAFARYFYTQVQRAFETKNPDLVIALSAPGCTSCDNYIRSLTKLRDNNERVENFTVRILVAVAPQVVGPRARVDVSWMTPDVAIRYDVQGREIFRDGPYKRVDDQFNLTYGGAGWRVSAIQSLRRQR